MKAIVYFEIRSEKRTFGDETIRDFKEDNWVFDEEDHDDWCWKEFDLSAIPRVGEELQIGPEDKYLIVDVKKVMHSVARDTVVVYC